jgi:osmotically-inducible protein OsmY
MADNNRNWGGYRSSNQDWDDNDNRNESGDRYSRGRYEGGYGNDWGRSGQQDYGQGSTYGEGRYDRDYDNRGSYSSGQSERDYSNYGNYDRENRDRDRDRGYISGGFGFGESGFRSRYNRERQSYSPGGYQNYGGGSGYGANQWTGGYGGSNYGRNYGNNFGTGYGRGGYSSGGYGAGLSESFGRSSYDSGSGYGSGYGSNYGRGSDRYSGYSGSSYGDNFGRERDRGRDRDERGWWDRTTDEISSWFGDEEAERRRRMDRMHRGRGPKNYTRSDERIKEDINDRLSDDWFVDASDIDVTVQSGEVTLMGTVDERTAKRRAEDIAESVSGVKHVENRIRVSTNQDTYSGGTRSTSDMSTGSATGTTGVGATTGTTTRRQTTVSENK